MDPFQDVQRATRSHQARHGCGAYTYRDGSLLGVLAATVRATRIVEVGTALGYTSLWLAHGAPEAQVDTIEFDTDHARLARENIAAHELTASITVHEGRAEDVLPRLDGDTYDLAFFDGFAPTPRMVESLRQRLRPGALLVAGNLTLTLDPAVLDDLTHSTRWLTHSLGETALAIRRLDGWTSSNPPPSRSPARA